MGAEWARLVHPLKRGANLSLIGPEDSTRNQKC